jgi:hypothetical protein
MVARHGTPSLDLPDSGDVSLEALAEHARFEASDAGFRVTQLRGGLALARSLMVLIGLVLVLITVFAVFTYPGDVATPENRTEWFTEIKDLVQLLVVSLLVPTLATLIGYIFSRQPATERGT